MTGIPRPIVWSISGTDSGGGAGLSADQRAADAFGVHLCPVVAAVTAQNSRVVDHLRPMPPELLDAQLRSLAKDMPPRVVKTGLLGGVAQLRVVVDWIDRLRALGPVDLVVDPVFGASTGAEFADAAMRQAYREELLPRANLATPNRSEGLRLWGQADVPGAMVPDAIPGIAAAWRALGVEAVCVTGGDHSVDGQALDWLDTPHARGWLALKQVATRHQHGTGCTFASSAAAAIALGFVPADALVLAKMATTQALQCAYAAGSGAGPVCVSAGFGTAADLLPELSWDADFVDPAPIRRTKRSLGLYAIVDSVQRVEAVLAAGVRTVQLRIKAPGQADAAWTQRLRDAVRGSVAACQAAGAELFINDHWELARDLGAHGVHLGQEDLLGLGPARRQAIADSGLILGISSHSLWELCRARSLRPRYIACGPVWPTRTKAMPWHAQGLPNLRWWCHMAQTPVVAIGGIMDAAQVAAAAACGVDGVCVVRALGDDPAQALPALLAAMDPARLAHPRPAPPSLPAPSLGAR